MTIIEAIGNTPLIKLQRINPNPKVSLYAKLEGNNPGGSVKDRAALGMITEAIESGQLQSGQRIVEATSGNTGIALAMIAAIKQVPITLIMPETATEERKQAMLAYGADLILTDGDKGIEYSRQLANEYAQKDNFITLNQFANEANPNMHYKTTGPEIWQQSKQRITHFVSAMGTTGTIIGVSKYLKEQNPNVQIVGVQPKEGSKIPGIRKWSHNMVPEICDFSRIDTLQYVDRDQAIQTAKTLAREEGILAGMSSGGACTIALETAKQLDEGFIVFIVCDRGDRYLSSGIFG